MLADKIEAYNNGIIKFKKTEKEYKKIYPFLKEASSRWLQQSRIDLDNAYKNFFRNIKQWKKPWFPKFKSKHSSKLSYREPQTNGQIKIKWNKITLLKLWDIKFRWRVEWKIKSVTIENTRDWLYTASVLVEVEDKINTKKWGIIWIDLWLKDLATTSDGNIYHHITIDNSKEKKIRKSMSRSLKVNWIKSKRSNRFNKLKKKLNKETTKQSNTKKHFHYNVIKDIISDNQTIVVENLHIKWMMKNKKLSSSFQWKSLWLFRNRLLQKCEMLWKEIIEWGRFFASSKICCRCKNKKDDLKLSDRIYCCDKCNLVINRDFNASLNLKALSLEYNDYERGGIVRLVNKSFDLKTSKFHWVVCEEHISM